MRAHVNKALLCQEVWVLKGSESVASSYPVFSPVFSFSNVMNYGYHCRRLRIERCPVPSST